MIESSRPPGSVPATRTALEQADAVEFVGGGLIGDIHDVHREPRGQAVIWQVLGEIGGIASRIGRAKALDLLRVGGRIDERAWRFRLAAEGVHLEEVDVPKGVADSGVAQPLLP